MSFTFYTCLGTGQYEEDDTGVKYRETDYDFGNNLIIHDSILLNAVINSKKWDIKKLVIIGTITSCWDALFAENDKYSNPLWDVLFKNCSDRKNKNKAGISREQIVQLEEYLSDRYSIPVKIIAHTSQVSEDTIEGLAQDYYSLFSERAERSKILLDITHGFRSMGILLFQTFQLHSQEIKAGDLELFYAELHNGEASPIRYLTQYWNISELNRQLYNFKTTLRGDELAVSVEPFWKEGADCLKLLSFIVRMNYAMQINKLAEKIKGACDRFSPEGKPDWVVDLMKELKDMARKLNKPTPYEKYFAFAELLYEKGLTTQAVIALTAALQTRVMWIMNKTDPDMQIGSYEGWTANGSRTLSLFLDGTGDLRRDIEELRVLRNRIAHAGQEQWDSMPKVKEIDYPRFSRAVSQVFIKLGGAKK